MSLETKTKVTRASFWVCLLASVGLLVAGFVAPPTGVIDPSVLSAVGELFGFATLAQVPAILEARRARITHGDTTIEIEHHENTH